MKLAQLIEKLDVIETWENSASLAAVANPDIQTVHYRAQEVTVGDLFVAVKGFVADGHDYIEQAVSNGAVAVVCEHPVRTNAIMIQVPNSRKALAQLSAVFYGHPSCAMTIIGITGTNGKTTTSYLIESVLQTAGVSVGVIGTINYRYADKQFDNPVTTPESLDLQRILAKMRDAGVSHVVMEISSHALDLYRIYACKIDIGVFTNFTQDHLDYHKHMDTYWSCKRRLFAEFLPAFGSQIHIRAVINVADPKGVALSQEVRMPLLSYGAKTSDICATVSRFDLKGIYARITTPVGRIEIRSSLVGRHNLENILSAVGVAVALKIAPPTVADGINALQCVPGRLERILNTHHRYIYVDYAHTPDALENALLALRALTVDRIICVFGCGGDRDRTKRPEMGATAARLSDLVVVTSDNPRTESPVQIIEEIEAGLRSTGSNRYIDSDLQAGFQANGYVVIEDRGKAIRRSIAVSRPGDTIFIAGKGHESYQIIGRERFSFDDRLEVQKALAEVL